MTYIHLHINSFQTEVGKVSFQMAIVTVLSDS